jgi:PAS domain S-box-containing protein
MLGYTLEEFVQLSIADLHLPADLPFVYAQIEEFLRGGQPIRYDIRFRRKDGSILFADLSPSLMVLDGRRYILVALKDITERKRAEEELRRYSERLGELVAARTGELQESERRYRGLVEKINDWVWEIDANGVYTYVSPRARELLGYAPEEIVGKTPFDLMPPAEAQRVWNAFEPIWLGRKPLELLENTLVRKDGRLVTVETSGMPVFAEDGTFLGYTGIDRDVTERKRAEEALREKEYLLSESQRIGHIGTWSADPGTGIGTWTPEMYRLFGVSPDTFVPTVDAFLDLLHPEDRDAMREWMRAALAGEHPGGLEIRVPLPDGSVRVLIGRGEAIFADSHRPVRLVGTAQDVTERKHTEEALRQLSRRNEEALRVARMGHWEFDLATGLFTFNDQYYTLHGITAREAGGYQMTAAEFARRYVHPDDVHLVQETIQEAATAEDPNYQFRTEARILRADGEARWVTVWFRIEKDAQGRTTRLYGVNQDITERRHAEDALRQSERRYRKLFEANLAGVYLTKPDGTILDFNDAMMRMLGYDAREEIFQHRSSDFYADPELRQELLRLLEKDGVVPGREAVLRRENPTSRVLRSTSPSASKSKKHCASGMRRWRPKSPGARRNCATRSTGCDNSRWNCPRRKTASASASPIYSTTTSSKRWRPPGST